MMALLSSALGTLILLPAMASNGAGENPDEVNPWNQFLGGVGVEHQGELPLEWSPEKNVAWRVKIDGHGQSSPVVWGQQVYVTSTDGDLKDDFHLTAYNLEDGQRLWKVSLKNSAPVANNVYVSRAAPTPIVDSEGVYAFFESGDMIAVDHQGSERWTRNLKEDHGEIIGRFGLGASPCQNASHLFVLADHEGPSYLLAIEKQSGEDAWKTDREAKVSWSSPVMAEIDGHEQIVISSTGSADGYDTKTGAKLWTLEGLGGNTAATPVVFDGNAIVLGASPGRRGENTETAAKSNLLMTIETTEDGFEPQVQWRAKRVTSSFGSPICHEGYAYWVNRTGILFCVDMETGEVQYSERLEQACWATPLGFEDRIYVFGKDGMTTVVSAGPDFKVLAQNELFSEADLAPPPSTGDAQADRGAQTFGGPIQYGYALHQDAIIMRVGETLFRIEGAE